MGGAGEYTFAAEPTDAIGEGRAPTRDGVNPSLSSLAAVRSRFANWGRRRCGP
jgi:hypothetical protein